MRATHPLLHPAYLREIIEVLQGLDRMTPAQREQTIHYILIAVSRHKRRQYTTTPLDDQEPPEVRILGSG